MGKLIDLAGQRFDMVTVLSREGTQKALATWKCRCDCGKVFIVKGNTFSRKKFKSCGCVTAKNKPSTKRLNLVGLKFGMLTVIEPAGTNKHGKTLWKCRCDCGDFTTTLGSALVNGNTASCRCSSKQRIAEIGKQNAIDLTNQRFGRLTAIRRDGQKGSHLYWLCQCDCGKETQVRATRLSNGLAKSCGCSHLNLVGENHPNWKGGRRVDYQGYVILGGYVGTPNANKHGAIREHVLVMSQTLGRPLRQGETVHHKNGIRDDNRPENLELWVKGQPSGQRVSDRIADAVEILKIYAPHLLNTDAASEFIKIGENTVE